VVLSSFDLNLRHLRALSEIVARGSMSAAAEAVSLSQPALTQGLRKLERQLETALFERHSDGSLPTADGLAMAARAEAAFAALAAATRGAARGGGRGFARPERLMTSTQLNAALALADAGSFAAAAAATGLSQPALHRAVRDLEQVCGIPIADRQGRGVSLTPAGRRIIRGIRLAAGEIAAGIADLSANPEDAGRIAIGALPLCRALVLPHAIAAFLSGTPRAAIDVVEGSWRELVDPLRDGRIDLMIGALRPEPLQGLEQRALFDDRLAIVGRAGHPLANIAQPTIDDLRRFGWVVGQTQTPLRGHWDALFPDGSPPPTPVECGSVMVIRGILAASDLLTLLSPDQVALEVKGGVLALIGQSSMPAMRTIGITTRAGWRPTAAQQRFVALVEQAARETRLSKIQ
jgi:DNA-binding transcriptional LysR family regulator